MPEKTKAQLKQELQVALKRVEEVNGYNQTLAKRLEEQDEMHTKAINACAERREALQKINAELGARIREISEQHEKDVECLGTCGKRLGQLESEAAELTAFKQDALQAMDRQQKEIELLKEKEKAHLRCIEEMKKDEREVADEYHKCVSELDAFKKEGRELANAYHDCLEELNATKKENEQLKNNIVIDGERYFDLMTGPFIDIVRVRLYLKYGIGKEVR